MGPLPLLAGRPIHEMEMSLRLNDVVSMVRNPTPGTSESYIATLLDELSAVWKPHKLNTSNYKHEILAYELSQKFGFNLVPPTVERTINDRVGSLQLYRDSIPKNVEQVRKWLHRVHLNPTVIGTIVTNVDKAELDRCAFFDFLIFTQDREGTKNWLLSPECKLVAIDHEKCFESPNGPVSTLQILEKYIDGVDRFMSSDASRPIVIALKGALTDVKFHDELRAYISETAIRSFLKRAELLVMLSS